MPTGVSVPSRARQPAARISNHGMCPSPAKRGRLSDRAEGEVKGEMGGGGAGPPLLPAPMLSLAEVSAEEENPVNVPARTSSRIRSMTAVVTPDGRKRLRKT